MLLSPENAALHRPDIDEISHHIERVAVKGAQESQESVRLTATGSEMDIGNPHAPVMVGGDFLHNMSISREKSSHQEMPCHNFAILEPLPLL